MFVSSLKYLMWVGLDVTFCKTLSFPDCGSLQEGKDMVSCVSAWKQLTLPSHNSSYTITVTCAESVWEMKLQCKCIRQTPKEKVNLSIFMQLHL